MPKLMERKEFKDSYFIFCRVYPIKDVSINAREK